MRRETSESPMKSAHRSIVGAILGTGLAVGASGGLIGTAQAAVAISDKPTENMTCSAGTCTATAEQANLNVNTLMNMLAAGDLKVTTGNAALDIDVEAPFRWASTGRLTLDAFHSIHFKAQAMVAGTGAVTLITNDGGSGGDHDFAHNGHLEFWDIASDLTINGQRYVLTDSLRSLHDLVLQNPNGLYALMKSYGERAEFKRSPISAFIGVFEGLGNSITGLNVSDSSEKASRACEGMFGRAGKAVGDGTAIRNLNLKNVRIATTYFKYAAAPFVGCNFALITRVSADGTVQGGYGNGAYGGLVGENWGTIKFSHSAVRVSSNDLSGGLVSANYGTIDQSYATGSVFGHGGGGLLGAGEGGITNCYATGSVTVVGNYYGGGLVGAIRYTISSSYATGVVSGSGVLGGFIGYDNSQNGLSSDYWDLDTSGISDPGQGAGNIANDPGITGLTDAQLKSGLPVGFDPAVWGQNPNINNGYPFLLANPLAN